jgi:hypothetical protein
MAVDAKRMTDSTSDVENITTTLTEKELEAEHVDRSPVAPLASAGGGALEVRSKSNGLLFLSSFLLLSSLILTSYRHSEVHHSRLGNQLWLHLAVVLGGHCHDLSAFPAKWWSRRAVLRLYIFWTWKVTSTPISALRAVDRLR